MASGTAYAMDRAWRTAEHHGACGGRKLPSGASANPSHVARPPPLRSSERARWAESARVRGREREWESLPPVLSFSIFSFFLFFDTLYSSNPPHEKECDESRRWFLLLGRTETYGQRGSIVVRRLGTGIVAAETGRERPCFDAVVPVQQF